MVRPPNFSGAIVYKTVADLKSFFIGLIQTICKMDGSGDLLSFRDVYTRLQSAHMGKKTSN